MAVSAVTVLLGILDQARQAVPTKMSALRALTVAISMPFAKILLVVTLVHATPATAAMVLPVRITTNVRTALILAIPMRRVKTHWVPSLAPATLASRAMGIPAPTSTNVAAAIMVDVIHSRRALILLEAIIALPAHRATLEPARPDVSRSSLPLRILAKALCYISGFRRS